MAYPSLPSFKAIFVGGRPLWLTRLKRKEAKASLYTPEAVKKKKVVSIRNQLLLVSLKSWRVQYFFITLKRRQTNGVESRESASRLLVIIKPLVHHNSQHKHCLTFLAKGDTRPQSSITNEHPSLKKINTMTQWKLERGWRDIDTKILKERY